MTEYVHGICPRDGVEARGEGSPNARGSGVTPTKAEDPEARPPPVRGAMPLEGWSAVRRARVVSGRRDAGQALPDARRAFDGTSDSRGAGTGPSSRGATMGSAA